MGTVNTGSLVTFKRQCLAIGIEPPAAIEKGMHVLAVAEATQEDPPADLLTMTDSKIRAYVEAISLRRHDRDGRGSMLGLAAGLDPFRSTLAAQVHAASLPDLERISEELRPKFDEAVAPLHVAAQTYGITYATTPAEILDRDDEKVSRAYRAMREAWGRVDQIASLRIAMSQTFDLSPTLADVQDAMFPAIVTGSRVNYSVVFAATDDNWSLGDGYYIESGGRGGLDWLALAAGGLRLNSPAEVLEKIHRRAQAAHANGETIVNIGDSSADDFPGLAAMPRYPR